MKITTLLFSVSLLSAVVSCKTTAVKERTSAQNQLSLKMNNPIITDKYTADLAAIVYKDKVYLYAGHDVPPKDVEFLSNERMVGVFFFGYGQLARTSNTIKTY